MPCVVWSHMVEFRVRILSWLVGCATWQINTFFALILGLGLGFHVNHKVDAVISKTVVISDKFCHFCLCSNFLDFKVIWFKFSLNFTPHVTPKVTSF